MTSRVPIEAYRTVSEDPARATALPGAAYTDPLVFAAEGERVLRAGWLPVARLDQLANEGDYACTDVARAPVVALRDEAERSGSCPLSAGTGACPSSPAREGPMF